MSNAYNLSIEQGSSFSINLVARDSAGVELNLSGYSASGGLKYGYGSAAYLVGLTTTVDISYVSGIISVSLTPEQTSLLPVTKAVYDVEVYNSGGHTFKAIRGYADILPEVTNV